MAPHFSASAREQKHSHWDWSLVQEPSLRFENLVAGHLLKWVHHEQDTRGRDIELRYFRDTDRREVDFVTVDGRMPQLMVVPGLRSLAGLGGRHAGLRHGR